MTNIERVLQYVRAHPGKDDDDLSEVLNIKPRQQVNQICNRLVREGVMLREVGPSGKIVNRIV
jgi:hypothetical protein